MKAWVDTERSPKYLTRRLLRARCRSVRARETALSLNALSPGSLRDEEAIGVARAIPQRPTGAQSSVLRGLRAGVALFGPRPLDLCESGALLELLNVGSLYDESECRVAPFDPTKLS